MDERCEYIAKRVQQQQTVRLARAIARAGICSRRDADTYIAQKRVVVNGCLVTSPATSVSLSDTISIDGKILPAPEPTRLWLYHKPAGLITSNRDEKERKTIFTDLPKTLPRVVTVGRLDMNSEGLLLLTNDGHLAHTLEMPSNAWKRTYKVRVYGYVNPEKLKNLQEGITIGAVKYGPIKAFMENAQQKSANTWLKVTLTEGKNREIRRVMQHIGYTVNRIIRTSYGAFTLGVLKKSEVKEVSRRDIYCKALGQKPKESWAKAKSGRQGKPAYKAKYKKRNI